MSARVVEPRPAAVPGTPKLIETQGIPRRTLGDGTSTIGQIRKDPSVLYGIFVELARQIFSPAGQDAGSPWIWDKDPSKATLWVDNATVWRDRTPSFRPAVYVSLAPLTYASPTGVDKGLMNVAIVESEYDYVYKATGKVTWNVLGNTNGEGLTVGERLMAYVQAFANVIREEYCFTTFYVSGFIPEQVVKEGEDKEQYRTVLEATFGFNEAWTLKLESPKLNAVVFHGGQQLLDLLHSRA